jgi:AAA15 family ATPase/GTPase
MIIDFTVENFLSFRDPQTLSFVAEPPYSVHSNHLLETPFKDIKLLKTVVIYGANASGKSNFLTALHRLKELVLSSAKNAPNDDFKIMPFLLDYDKKQEPTFFDINFFCENIKYNYSIILDSEKVHSESLSFYPKKYKKNIFTRDVISSGDYIYSFGEDLKPKRIYEDISLKTAGNVLFLSKAVQENSKFLKPIYDWFDITLSEESSLEDTAKLIDSNKEYKTAFLEFLSSQDINIVDVNVDKSSVAEKIISTEKDIPPEIREQLLKNFKDKFFYEIKTYHEDNKKNLVQFDFELESRGTHKLFAISQLLLTRLNEQAKTFYVDELSSALHPLLVRNFLKTFQNNTTNQLVCVTHDTHLISQDCLRKDQIYFVEKDSDQSSSIYSLLEFTPRNDRENWELRYLSGRYGATPFLK